MKMVNLAVALLLFCVADLVLLGSTMVFQDPSPNQGAATTQTPSNSNGLTFVGTISFQFENTNVSELTVAAGSAVQGTVLMNISQAAPLLIFVDDSGAEINQTTPTLPAGISVSLEMYGNSYNVPSVYEVAFNDTTGLPLSTVQLVPTTLGETSIQYTINVATNVAAGVYNVKILFMSMLKGDMLPADYPYDSFYGYGECYTVILHVQ